MARCWLRTTLTGLVVVVGLGALAACSGGRFFGEREPWRKEAEARCMGAGEVREGPGVVRISPINGPGMCGADFPLQVSSLGIPEALSFSEPVRPPGAIPQNANTNARRAVSPLETRPLPPPMVADPPLHPQDFRRPYGGGAPLGPYRAARPAMTTVSVTPKATLACPLVSALDQWVASAVQPSAMRWFGQSVIEIKQISAYSCRGMNGNPNARISEHAFGNALDIAAFTLANGRQITVKDGWRGPPEEQGFLRDVHGAACDRFTTVLAPGSDVFHYDHMHVDLMRRANGYRVCNPRAVPGEEVAARARRQYSSGSSPQPGREPQVTGSLEPGRKGGSPKAVSPAATRGKVGHQLPLAIPGEDGSD
jgi:Extensin-like protein C-terminus